MNQKQQASNPQPTNALKVFKKKQILKKEKEMIKELTIEEILKVLRDDKKPDVLIGQLESVYFEARSQLYNTLQKDGISKGISSIELAKDISAIANSGGGIICIGLKTKSYVAKLTEIVTALKPININSSECEKYIQSYFGILKNLLYPVFSANDWEFGWINLNDGIILWIYVKDSKETKEYPLIVTKDQYHPEKDVFVKGEVFGIYHRDNSDKRIVPIGAIHLQFNHVLLQNLDKIEIVKNKVIDDIGLQLEKEEGFLYLIAIPQKEVKIEGYLNTSETSIYHLLKNAPYLRNNGWNFQVESIEIPENKSGEWQIRNERKKLIKVSRDGIIKIGASIPGFLDWTTPQTKTQKSINCLALAEFIKTFGQFISNFKMNFNLTNDYLFYVGIRANSNATYNLLLDILYPNSIVNLEASEVKIEIPELLQMNSNIIGGNILREIYDKMFCISSPYPYLIEKDGIIAINEEQIKKSPYHHISYY